jgi:hypothetical protein
MLESFRMPLGNFSVLSHHSAMAFNVLNKKWGSRWLLTARKLCARCLALHRLGALTLRFEMLFEVEVATQAPTPNPKQCQRNVRRRVARQQGGAEREQARKRNRDEVCDGDAERAYSPRLSAPWMRPRPTD